MNDGALEHDAARFRVMGTDAHVVVVGGPPGLCERAEARLERFEAQWSRFRDTSEISRLNAAAGRPVVVSPGTFELIRRAVRAWELTDGAFDPTVLVALTAAGYDRDYAEVAPDGVGSSEPSPLPPGAGVVELDAVVGAVRLPPGVALDLGGIGKGFAADLVAGELLGEGAQGVCVNLGGDLRVRGVPPSSNGWTIEIEEEPGSPTGSAPPVVLVVADGAVATTSRRRRVWRRGGEERHHIIDPRTGRAAQVLWSSVTVIAGCAADAEPAATAAFLADDRATAAGALRVFGAAGLAYDELGRPHALGDVSPFVARAA
jgi:thiamine biosynthesis lipoprotein